MRRHSLPVLEWIYIHFLAGVRLLAGFSLASRGASRFARRGSSCIARAGRARADGDALDGLHRYGERPGGGRGARGGEL